MFRNVLMLALFVFVGFVFAAPDGPKVREKLEQPVLVPLEGYYWYEGFAADTDYHGIALITRDDDHNYLFYWYTGSQVSRGIGAREGNKISVGWFMGVPGISRFEISTDDKGKAKLVGAWVASGIKGGGKETLTFVRALKGHN